MSPPKDSGILDQPLEQESEPPAIGGSGQLGSPGRRAFWLALVLGSAGGMLCYWLRMPLAWMLGAALATSFAAFGGLRVGMSPKLREVMLIVLGVLLGSSFRPDLMTHVGAWTVSLAVLTGVTMCSALAGYAYYRVIGRYNRPTAFFSSVPGGLGVMTVMGGAMGGDERVIAISHAVRIICVVVTIPLWFRINGIISGPTSVGIHLTDLAAVDLAALVTLGVAGALLGNLLKLPAATLVGPMLLSAAAHFSGITRSQPPMEIVAAAQVVIGTAIGCRFVDTSGSLVMRALRLGVLGGLLSVGAAVGGALFAHLVATGLPFYGLLLSYSPGGVAEMSLIALSLGIDVAMVATHHLFRLFFVLVTAPQLYRMWQRSLKR